MQKTAGPCFAGNETNVTRDTGYRLLYVGVVAIWMSGCASFPGGGALTARPAEQKSETKVTTASPVSRPATPAPTSPPIKAPAPDPAPPPPPYPDSRKGEAIIAALLPTELKDRTGWAKDIYVAFAALQIPLNAENVCAVAAITAQESGFQVDPSVPGLPGIVKRELARRQKSLGLPQWMIDKALAVKSPTGRTYQERIAALRSEGDLNRLYADMTAELPLGKSLLAGFNPVRTGGPMQVSVDLARQHMAANPYPYVVTGTLRDEVFSRRGGMYFGIANLLHYPTTYDAMIYRFADFNAGHYASRNAAVQLAVTRLTGVPLVPDGDLLRYQDGVAITSERSQTRQAIETLGVRLSLSREEILRDLLLEKNERFVQSPLYLRLFALAESVTGAPVVRAAMPSIELKSAKITRKLTTEWFARRVDWRFQQCLKRKGGA